MGAGGGEAVKWEEAAFPWMPRVKVRPTSTGGAAEEAAPSPLPRSSSTRFRPET